MTIRVFLADDHAIVRDGLRFILQAQPDMTVVGEATDGRQAVDRVKKLNPDVVIMDITMPTLNGIEATRQILQSCPSTRIVILSVHSTPEHIYRSFQAGVQGYILKESAGAEVVDAVRTVHAGERYLCRKIASNVIDDYIRQQESTAKDPLERLTPREREVLQLVAEGKSSKEISGLLHLSAKTVETYRSRLMEKLGISGIPGLVKFAIQHGLISLE
jgi:DNA-binding NarL/FixJ family response regulator